MIWHRSGLNSFELFKIPSLWILIKNVYTPDQVSRYAFPIFVYFWLSLIVKSAINSTAFVPYFENVCHNMDLSYCELSCLERFGSIAWVCSTSRFRKRTSNRWVDSSLSKSEKIRNNKRKKITKIFQIISHSLKSNEIGETRFHNS